MRGVNKVVLIGQLGRDPETKYLPSGDPVTTFSVATSESWKDKSGQKQEKTEWHNIVCFKRLAEIASEYLRKGSKVFVEGSLRTQQWEKDGQKHYRTEIVARELQMLDGRQEQRQSGRPTVSDDDLDDDIPFAFAGWTIPAFMVLAELANGAQALI